VSQALVKPDLDVFIDVETASLKFVVLTNDVVFVAFLLKEVAKDPSMQEERFGEAIGNELVVSHGG